MSDGSTRTDEELLRRVAAGDRGDALVALYRAYSPRIHRLGLRTLHDGRLAEELVQETFVRLWQSSHRFDPARGSARTFTFTIAQRVAIDLLRRAASHPRLVAAVAAEAAGMSSGDEDAVERRSRPSPPRRAPSASGRAPRTAAGPTSSRRGDAAAASPAWRRPPQPGWRSPSSSDRAPRRRRRRRSPTSGRSRCPTRGCPASGRSPRR